MPTSGARTSSTSPPRAPSLLERVRAIALGHSARFFGVLAPTEQAELLRMLMKLYEAHVAALPTTVPRT